MYYNVIEKDDAYYILNLIVTIFHPDLIKNNV